MTEPQITPAIIAKHGLTPDEYARIETILGRAPNFTELGIFSVMWSEHCSYKNSKRELRKFPTTGPTVLVKAGEENAGVIDIGDGWAIAFKMESHNHPSAIEPFQGAATGVGGIIRDIFTMGARPVFSLNSLRFGPIVAQASRLASRRTEAGGFRYHRRQPPPVRGRGRGHRALRELHRHPDHRRGGLFRRKLRGQSARERLQSRHPPARANRARRGEGHRQSGLLRRCGDGARRPRRRGLRLARTDRGEQAGPARRAGRRPVQGKAPARSLPRIARDRRRRRHSGHGRGGADVLDLRDREPRRHRRGNRPRKSAQARDGHDALRDHAQRVAGAHAHHREKGARADRRGHLSRNGICPTPKSAWSKTTA